MCQHRASPNALSRNGNWHASASTVRVDGLAPHLREMSTLTDPQESPPQPTLRVSMRFFFWLLETPGSLPPRLRVVPDSRIPAFPLASNSYAREQSHPSCQYFLNHLSHSSSWS